jgi:cyclase
MVNNMGFIESSRGNISIDVTSTEKRTAAYLAAIKSATGQDVRYLVYTHAHPDHCNGASLLEDAVVVAHENARTELRASQPVAGHIFTPFDQGSARRGNLK